MKNFIIIISFVSILNFEHVFGQQAIINFTEVYGERKVYPVKPRLVRGSPFQVLIKISGDPILRRMKRFRVKDGSNNFPTRNEEELSCISVKKISSDNQDLTLSLTINSFTIEPGEILIKLDSSGLGPKFAVLKVDIDDGFNIDQCKLLNMDLTPVTEVRNGNYILDIEGISLQSSVIPHNLWAGTINGEERLTCQVLQQSNESNHIRYTVKIEERIDRSIHTLNSILFKDIAICSKELPQSYKVACSLPNAVTFRY